MAVRFNYCYCVSLMVQMETRDVAAIIALMLGPAILATFLLWCALGGWIGP
jgi:hypothetical protein